jgi:hypothetical protein
MSTHLPQELERRRSPRVVLEQPLQISWRNAHHGGRTSVVSAHGALVLTPFSCPEGSILKVTNLFTGLSAHGRVVASSPMGSAFDPGMRFGIEFIDAQPHFWGARYESPLTNDAPTANASDIHEQRVAALVRIPVDLDWGTASCRAEAVVVGAHSALVLSPVGIEPGVVIQVQNTITKNVARFRVDWRGDVDGLGRIRLGLAAVDERPEFWNES